MLQYTRSAGLIYNTLPIFAKFSQQRMKIFLQILFLQLTFFCHAQQLQLPALSNSGFAKDILTLQNDAHENFKKVKGKITSKVNETTTVYKIKRKLDGATDGRIVQFGDSVYCEYIFDKVKTESEAQKLFDKLYTDIEKSLKGYVRAELMPVNMVGGELMRKKIGFSSLQGLYQPNMELSLVNPIGTNVYRIFFRIMGGDLPFYHSISKNQPIYSPVFKEKMKKILDAVQNNQVFALRGDAIANASFHHANLWLPGYESFVETDSISTFYRADKYNNNSADAAKEFDFAITNMQMSLGSEYLYCFNPPKDTLIQCATFVKLTDLFKAHPCKVNVEFLEPTRNKFIIRVVMRPGKKEGE
jgi:hypothetical protein